MLKLSLVLPNDIHKMTVQSDALMLQEEDNTVMLMEEGSSIHGFCDS